MNQMTNTELLGDTPIQDVVEARKWGDSELCIHSHASGMTQTPCNC